MAVWVSAISFFSGTLSYRWKEESHDGARPLSVLWGGGTCSEDQPFRLDLEMVFLAFFVTLPLVGLLVTSKCTFLFDFLFLPMVLCQR